MTPPRALAAAAVVRRILVVNGCILNLLQISMFEDMSASNMERLSFPVTIGRVFNFVSQKQLHSGSSFIKGSTIQIILI